MGEHDPTRFDVVWHTPSRDAAGSMPLGNGQLAANVWVEPLAQDPHAGQIVLLMARTDAWDENASLLKLGRVRVSLDPPLRVDDAFEQRLRLRSGRIDITAGTGEERVELSIECDVDSPVMLLQARSASPRKMRVELDVWRTQDRVVGTQTGDLFRNLEGPDPHPTIRRADVVLDRPERLLVCHHNIAVAPDPYAVNLKLQGLDGFQQPHPLCGRTFGLSVGGPELKKRSLTRLESDARTQLTLVLAGHTAHPSTVEQWAAEIESMPVVDAEAVRARSEAWWSAFWTRSHLVVSGDSDADSVSRAYALQRFVNACAGRGPQPIKHNGSVFSVGKPDDPDFRRWGGSGFWFQNQRLIYWPMLAAGDFDLLEPFFRMYVETLPLHRHRTRTYFSHDGAHVPETITFWGTEISAHYGWTPFAQRTRPEAECPYVTYHWSGMLELIVMMCERYERSRDDAFVREQLVPLAAEIITFYDLHYPRRDDRLHIAPAGSLETWHEAENPLPEIAGLRYTIERLLALPDQLVPRALLDRSQRLASELPPLPVSTDDPPRLLPAGRFARKRNSENPELYAVFPFRLFGVGKPDLDLAIHTFQRREHPSPTCWSQDDIQMALLGLAEEARAWITRRASGASHSQSRFPAFWDAFHDWLPDIDHGGVLQQALQYMVMQCEGRAIRLLPAWPQGWDVDFKLHAPYDTLVACSVRGGRIARLEVTPPERRADVILPERARSAPAEGPSL
jgi:hypothetical protein